MKTRLGEVTQDHTKEEAAAAGITLHGDRFRFRGGGKPIHKRDPSKPAWTECECSECGTVRGFRTEVVGSKPVCGECRNLDYVTYEPAGEDHHLGGAMNRYEQFGNR